jgi:hypothetical protein
MRRGETKTRIYLTQLLKLRSCVDPYIFAWGNPLVSHPAALRPTATAFKEWADSQNLRLIWSCVDEDLEHVLAEPPFCWSIVTCIYEDVVDPAHVVHLTSPEAVGKTGVSVVKDLKKNLKRAERGDVEVQEVRSQEWEEDDKRAVEEGVQNWIKSRSGIQIASVSVLHDRKTLSHYVCTPSDNCSTLAGLWSPSLLARSKSWKSSYLILSANEIVQSTLFSRR